MFLDEKVGEFLEKLASSSATPGGGSAAALAGAMAASLVSMVCRLSKGGEMKAILSDSETLRGELSKLIEEDAMAFDEVMRAHRLPRGSGDEKRARKEAIEGALKKAARVPLIVAGRSLHVIRLAGRAARTCNRNAVSDAGSAVFLAYAALRSAALNVAINLKGIEDEDFRKESKGELSGILAEADAEMESAVAVVMENLK